MRRRIATLTVVAATLALAAFGVPLAVGITQLALVEEEAALARLADLTARSVQADLAHHVQPQGIPDSTGDVDLAVYGTDGQLILGRGPAVADTDVASALAGHPSHSGNDGILITTLPVADGHDVHGAVRATRPVASLYSHLLPAWLGMIGLAGLVLLAVWQLARHQARRLAEPLVDLSTNARRLGDGDFGVRATTTGIAEIDSVAAALNDTAERLDELLARERAFSAEASHQLRTPLTGLRFRLEAALHVPGQDPRNAIAAGIECADQLENTIDELLLLAREPEATRGEPVDVESLVRDVIATRLEELRAAGRPVGCSAEPPSLPRSPVSPAAVRQILNVLLDNAEIHGSGRVKITLRDASGAIAVDVADEGRGLDTESPGGQQRSGMGLGLARRLAEAEGGRVVMTSSSPTVFTMLLPAERSHDQNAGDESAAHQPGNAVQHVEHPLVRAKPS